MCAGNVSGMLAKNKAACTDRIKIAVHFELRTGNAQTGPVTDSYLSKTYHGEKQLLSRDI